MDSEDLDVEMSSASSLEYTQNDFGNSHPVLPEMSPIMLEDSEEINSLSLTWREYIIFTMRVQVLARQKQEKEQKADFYRVLQFSYLPKAL